MPFTIGPAELLVVIVDAAIVALPLVLVIVIARAVASRSARPDPRALLADRLARGEITRAEFDTAMRAIGLVE